MVPANRKDWLAGWISPTGCPDTDGDWDQNTASRQNWTRRHGLLALMLLRPTLGKGANEKKEKKVEKEGRRGPSLSLTEGVRVEARPQLPACLPLLLWLLLPMSSLGATPSSAQQQPDSTAMLTFQDPRCLNDYLPLLHQALLEK